MWKWVMEYVICLKANAIVWFKLTTSIWVNLLSEVDFGCLSEDEWSFYNVKLFEKIWIRLLDGFAWEKLMWVFLFVCILWKKLYQFEKHILDPLPNLQLNPQTF